MVCGNRDCSVECVWRGARCDRGASQRFFEPSKEDGSRNDKMNIPRVAQAALFAYTRTPFWVYARASLRPRIPKFMSHAKRAPPQSLRIRDRSVITVTSHRSFQNGAQFVTHTHSLVSIGQRLPKLSFYKDMSEFFFLQPLTLSARLAHLQQTKKHIRSIPKAGETRTRRCGALSEVTHHCNSSTYKDSPRNKMKAR